MNIKELAQQDIQSALNFALEVFIQYVAPDYTEQGIASFKKYLNDRQQITKLVFYGAYQDHKLIGIIAAKANHIALFFVDHQYQNQGIGRKLFTEILKLNQTHTITVNSSRFAVAIYHKLGFTPTDNEQCVDGIKFIPMQYIPKLF